MTKRAEQLAMEIHSALLPDDPDDRLELHRDDPERFRALSGGEQRWLGVCVALRDIEECLDLRLVDDHLTGKLEDALCDLARERVPF